MMCIDFLTKVRRIVEPLLSECDVQLTKSIATSTAAPAGPEVIAATSQSRSEAGTGERSARRV
ncbi:hypothetical protein B5M45_08600 [Mycobacterium simiae]|uniref:Uncharacterized protein n=1 Tax=Mycobacterium simiae TaxID=1784 RepID=A0A1X0Y9I0_MYCSI|nr:hypothetical protein B5M45_08600 [Mycobacterium simiae]